MMRLRSPGKYSTHDALRKNIFDDGYFETAFMKKVVQTYMVAVMQKDRRIKSLIRKRGESLTFWKCIVNAAFPAF